ncbi:MAG: glycoside hydrolase family 65 protein [Endomicrobiales bacterium]|nr:glycoside hydrolase family 65 protein [Endomicrobiales bacterium]
MVEFIDKYLSDNEWLIADHEYSSELQNVRETQFALGNGYVGSRGILEEKPEGSMPGTFFAGIYDFTGAEVEELVNAPEPFHFKVMAPEGEKLGAAAMNIVKHSRWLDMQKGLLARKTVYSSVNHGKFDYQSLRFISMSNPNIAVIRVYITPLDKKTEFTIRSFVDTSVFNKGLVTEGDKKHFHIEEYEKKGNNNYLRVETLEKEIPISYATRIVVRKGRKKHVESHRVFKILLRKNETACITKYISFIAQRNKLQKDIKKETLKLLKNATTNGFDKLLESHASAWKKIWQNSDIKIKGDNDALKALRFNIYHLVISSPHTDLDVGIGAKGLVGEGYRGHVFWDSEIFDLPFFIYTNPVIAKNLLMYRCRRIDKAREIARKKGFMGAMFPWESADKGVEVTPSWYKDIKGKIKQVLTGHLEHHITADIAFGMYHYFQATNDIRFFLKYGLEIILSAAQFWASRVKYNKKMKKYEILDVISPDEFHEHVNNSAFTNIIASWNLKIAVTLVKTLRRKFPKQIHALLDRLKVDEKAMRQWFKIGSGIFIPVSKRTGIIESFQGYFKRKNVSIKESDHRFLPIMPKGITNDNIQSTQLIKQADIIMLFHVLPEMFSYNQKKINFYFYETKTMHQSSLSAAIHGIIASEFSNLNKAYKYFLLSLNADLHDVYGNTKNGIHAASLGGTWQVVFHGFCGIRILGNILHIDPHLPGHWKNVNLVFRLKSHKISVEINHKKASVKLHAVKREHLNIVVFGRQERIAANRLYTFINK